MKKSTQVLSRWRTLLSLIFLFSTTLSFAQKIAAGWSHSYYLCGNGSTVNAWGADTLGQLGNGQINIIPHSVPNTVNNLTGVKVIGSGYEHGIALKNDSTVWTWGSNFFGQLGNGTNVTSTAPVKVGGLSGIIAISGGQAGYHTLALKDDGTVWAWGKNTEGQLGDGTLNNSNVPVQVTGLTGVVAIAGGEFHSLAVRNDGTAWAWGRNSNGQLGDSTTTNSSVPVQVRDISGVTAIKGGRYWSMALLSDSTVWTWGQNADGQLGNGNTAQQLIPVPVSGLTEVIAIAGSAFHGLALKSDGTIRAWGRGSDGQLGDGLITASNVPVQVSGINNAVEIVSGTNYSFALTATDSIYSWGRNIYGQLGDGTSGNYRFSPVATAGLCTTSPFVPVERTIAAGWSHSFYLCNNGNTVNSWGADTLGQLGNGQVNINAHPVPGAVNNLTGVRAIRGGYEHSIALKNDSTVWSWGSNIFGQLGNGTNTTSTAPVQATGVSGIIAISGGQAGYHTLALKNDGTVWAWGKNTEGQLGDGTLNNSNIAVQVSGLTGVIAIAGGEFHSLALKNDGTVWAWGRNSNGQLGNNTTVLSSVPVQVYNLTGITAIAGGRYWSMALRSDSTVWSWGQNGDGQLGNGNTAQQLIPVQVSGLTEVTAIAGSAFHGLALKSDGTIRAWGRGSDGQLGDGLITASNVPVQVLGINNAVEIVSGTNYSFALTATDSIYSWGRNIYGQLGDASSGNYRFSPVATVGLCATSSVQFATNKISAGWSHTQYICSGDSSVTVWGANLFGQLGNGSTNQNPNPVPATVAGLTGAVSIAAGYQHTLVLADDSTVWAWGDNVDGELGNGTNVASTTPVQVSGLTEVISVSGGTAGYHSLALKADGTVWAWGKNADGQVGDGTNGNKNVPTQIAGLSNIVAVSGGEYHSLAIRNDGTVWAWGRNGNGQLGNNTVTSSNVPVQVLGMTGAVAIAAGRFYSIALRSDSTVWCWGENLYGQLGNGVTVDSYTPVQVTGLTDATAIAGGAFHGLAIKSDRTMVSWGRNSYGNLGDGTLTHSSVIVPVSLITDVIAIDGGTNYSIALRSDDSLFAFGRNVYGQIGDGTTVDPHVPVAVQGLCAIACVVNDSVTQAGALLSANAAGATYQWIDCGTNTPIANAMAQTYTATANGSYAVVVTQNNCSDTSDCLTVTGVGIEAISRIQFSVYPNPSATGKFRFANTSAVESIEVYNLLGKKVFSATNDDLLNGTIDISNHATGTYFMTVKTGGNTFNQKLIKQ